MIGGGPALLIYIFVVSCALVNWYTEIEARKLKSFPPDDARCDHPNTTLNIVMYRITVQKK